MEIRKRKPIGKKNIKYIEELYAEYSKRLFFIARKYVENEENFFTLKLVYEGESLVDQKLEIY